MRYTKTGAVANATDKSTLERAIQFVNMCKKHGFSVNEPMPGYTAREMREKIYKCEKIIDNVGKLNA